MATCYFCTKDPTFDGMQNPSYGTLGHYKASEPSAEVANSNTSDDVIPNEAAVYEIIPDNQDELVQSVKDHYEADYDVVL